MPAGGKNQQIDWNAIPDEAATENIDSAKLSQEIADVESAGGDYHALNPHTGAMGKYQFVPTYFWDDIKSRTGVKNRREFLDSPQKQEEYFKYHTEKNLLPSVEKLRKYNAAGYSDSQLARLVHFKGPTGAQEFLASGADKTKKHNISIPDYIGQPEGDAIDWNAIPDESSVEKKSPVASVSGLENSLQSGPGNSSPNNAQAQQGVLTSVFGTDAITGKPIVSAETQVAANTPEAKLSPTDRTKNAVDVIAKDFLDNEHLHPEETRNAFIANALPHEENPLNKITNPNGDPVQTAQYFKNRKEQLLKEMKAAVNTAKFSNPAAEISIPQEYNKKIAELEDASKYLTSLQLFQKEYADKPLTDAAYETKLDALAKKRESDIKNADKTKYEGLTGLDMDRANSRMQDKVAAINQQYQADVNKVRSKAKWDGVRLGIEQKRLMGDKQAELDAQAYDNGKPINPERRYKYQVEGNEIKKTGLEAAKHYGQESIASASEQHVQSDKQIERDNIDYFKDKWANQIGNEKYRDENPVLKAIGTVVPKFGNMSKKDIAEYGKRAGLSEDQIAEINPDEVPTSATVWQQFARGALNTAAPIYEQGIRAAVALTGGDQEAVNEHFQPGWENQRGLGAAIVGNMPSDQNSFHNVRGALGHIFEGAGGLSTFMGEVGGVAKGLEAVGIAADAAKAEKLANFGVMAFSGYNNAYHEANDVIGDKPEDEWKRQAYAIASGIVEGKIFSISPKTQMVKNALGIEEKTGQQLLQEIKGAKGVEALRTPEFRERMANYAQEIAKENGVQVSLAVANEIAKKTINTIVNPEMKQDISEDIKNTAISTSLTMLIPSIMGGVGHVRNQTPLNKAAMFELGSNPSKYTKFISEQLADGKITPQEAQQMHEGVLTMKNVIDNTPVQNIEGVIMTPDQVKDYSYNLFQEQLLQKKADALTKGASTAQIPVDKAQMEPINKRISELQKQRSELLATAGEMRPPAPDNEAAIEEQNQGENEERSVAPEAASEENTPETKKVEEKVANSEKEDISLSPLKVEDNNITQKNKDNEENSNGLIRSSESNEGGQVSTEISETAGRGQDSELRETTGGELPRVEEDRQLKEKENKETERKAAPETEQPLGVKGKRKREKVIYDEEAPPAEEVVAPTEEIISEAEVKPVENASTQSEEQQSKSTKQSSEPEHARVEQARSKEETPSPESGNRNIGGEAQKKVKPLKNQAKKGWSLTEHNNRRTKALREEPASAEEHVLQAMLAMNDKDPAGKWSLSSIEKDLPKGAAEKRIAKQFASDHPDAKPVDVWAHSLHESIGEKYGSEGIGNISESEIKDIIIDNISKFPTKTSLLEHIEGLHADRAKKRYEAENESGRYERREIGETEEGDAVYEYVDTHAEPTAQDLADHYSNVEGHEFVGYDDNGHPMHKRLSEGLDVIENSKLVESDEDAIVKHFESNLDKDGKVMWANINIEALKSELSPEGKKIIDALQPFNESHEQTIELQNIEQKTRKNEKQQEASADNAGDSEGAAKDTESERVPDSTADEQPADSTEPAAPRRTVKDVDNDILREKASLKDQIEKGKIAEKDRIKAMRSGDNEQISKAISEVNRRKDFVLKKQEKIERLSKERDEVIQAHREEVTRESYKNTADKIRSFGDKIAAGSEGVLMSAPGINPKLLRDITHIVADVVEATGNLHIAIDAAIRKLVNSGEKSLTEEERQSIEDMLSYMRETPEFAPELPVTHKKFAQELREEVEGGFTSYEEARQEIREKEFAYGKDRPYSEEATDKARAQILNYLDWHVKDREDHNTYTLREPKNENGYLDSYNMKGSDQTSMYLSGKTLQDVFGEDVSFDINSKETQLQDVIVQDSANMVGLAKHHAGSDDVLVYGPEMLNQISKMPDGEDGRSVKKLLAVTGLHNELHAQRTRLEEELKNADFNRSIEIKTELQKIKKMTAQTDVMYRDITSNASNVLNAARANRIYRNTFFQELYADRILNDETRAAKEMTEGVLSKTEVSEDIAEKGSKRTEREAKKEIESVLADQENSEAGQNVESDITGESKKEKQAKKSKSLIERIKDKVKGKKAERNVELDKKTAESKAKEYLKGESIEDLYKKAKEQTKKPC